MEKKQKSRFGGLNFLGIPIDPTLKEAASKYWMRCPSCGKRVVKKELIKKGCYACGWQGAEEEIELAQVKQMSETKSTAPKKEDTHSYWTDCPKCGRRVVREELGGKGCFICGYKAGMENKRDG